MKGEIVNFSDRAIRFLKDGFEAEQVLTLADNIKPEYIMKGRAEVTVKDNLVTFISMENGRKEKYAKPKKTLEKSKNKNVVNIQGKEFMTYEGLLKKAHEKGKFSMVITDSWVSEDMTKAWCKVRLTAGKQIFDGFGSSTPENTGEMTKTHPVEMANTRAKGRAFRDYLNIGQAMAEELKEGREK